MARKPGKQVETIYTQLGFTDRYHYFTTLADKFGIEVMSIILVAEKLGREQDFDGLLMWVKREAEICSSTNTQ